MQVAQQFMSEPAVAQGLQEAMGSIANASRGSGQSRQGPAHGEDPMGGLGAVFQSLGPMMQQLAVSSSASPHREGSEGAGRNAQGSSSSDDWQAALAELDAEEKAEWETIIRCWLNAFV